VGVVIKILVYAAALWVAVAILPGLDMVGEGSVPRLLAVALILGVINAVVRPILSILSLPLILLTLGLFLLVVNALSLQLVLWLSGALNLGLESDSFGWTFLAALVVSLVTWGLETLLRQG
jgi:putative membrane protein